MSTCGSTTYYYGCNTSYYDGCNTYNNCFFNDCSYNTFYCPSGTTACVDVAQFCANTTTVQYNEQNTHIINITNKIPITLTQFKKMFFSDGNHLSVAEPPLCPCLSDSIIESAWGIYSTYAYKCIADFSSNFIGTNDISENVLVNYEYTRSDKYKEWVFITDASGGKGWVPKSFLTKLQGVPVYNFNKLGGRNNDPSGVHLAYKSVDPSYSGLDFFAQISVLKNMQRDVSSSADCWTMCSRSSIFDQLYNLRFASTHFTGACMKLQCGRSWKEVIDTIKSHTQTWYLTDGSNSLMFHHLPGDPSSNRFPENIFSTLGSNITRVVSYPTPTYDASYNGVNWYYNTIIPWEIQYGQEYIINVGAPFLFTHNQIDINDTIALYINVYVYNDHCCIKPNIIRIHYICTVDQPIDNYCTC